MATSMKLCGWMAVFVAACVLAAPLAFAQNFRTFANFDTNSGYSPTYAALVQGVDGNLYGTATAGGTSGNGTAFKLTTTGTLTALHSFNFTDGSYPNAELTLATDGNFYGTTFYGGTGTNCGFMGCGTIFKLSPAGAFTTLYNFNSTDGANPFAGLLQASDGNFYSTTANGGSNACTGGCGTIFKMTPTGVLTTLHVFQLTDGANPWTALIQAADGNLYGTTTGGGANGSNGVGTVFRITRTGVLTMLHSFSSSDGAYPIGALVQANDGSFYGTTSQGGTNGGFGTVFKITSSGTLTNLHNFDYFADGTYPSGGLIQATDGNFYGTNQLGGTGVEPEF